VFAHNIISRLVSGERRPIFGKRNTSLPDNNASALSSRSLNAATVSCSLSISCRIAAISCSVMM
jgi:hypothetical protein